MIAVVVGLALFSAGDPGRRKALSEPPALRTGTLVFAADAEGKTGRQRLWKLDLATGRLRKGPRIPVAEELLAAPYPGIGWIGFVSVMPDGTRRAFVLHGTAPSDRPILLGSGDLVAWGPDGQHVVVATRGPLADDCHREVAIDLIRVETGDAERVFSRRNLCGDLLSVGRDGLATYFTRLSNDRLGIFYAGIGVAHLVLPDHALLSISSTSDMLVTPSESLDVLRLGPVPSRASVDPPPISLRGAVLYWRGRGGPVSLGDELDDLVVDRVLGWSTDASEVLVQGSLGERAGVFRVRTGPGEEPRTPTFVVTASVRAAAAYADDGLAYLAVDGRLYAFEGSRLLEIPLPPGAPVPAGPVAWTA